MMLPQKRVSSLFQELFQKTADFIVRSPGRVNLIGEHTDYNDGFVLPCAINYETCIAVGLRNDSLIKVIAADYSNQQDVFDIEKPITHHPQQQWSNYIRGVVHFLLQRNLPVQGLNLVISGNIPQGAGLSSSASLEVAVGLACQHAFNLNISKTEIALNGQQAENQFVGCNCGIMDQMVCANGKKDHALLLDCRSLETQLISMPEELSIVIVNSNIRRGLVDSEYNLRRQQCEQAARHYHVDALRDLDISRLEKDRSNLNETCYKRARHVVTENQRTLDAAKALANNDFNTLGHLMAQSHHSMRDDFEITVPAIDGLVKMINDQLAGQGGVRMTGGGFGGCVVALTLPEKVPAIIDAVNRYYPALFSLNADFYPCKASEGVGVIC